MLFHLKFGLFLLNRWKQNQHFHTLNGFRANVPRFPFQYPVLLSVDKTPQWLNRCIIKGCPNRQRI